MLDEVPIAVKAPPKMAAKDRGMNSREGESRSRRHQSPKIGRYIATSGVLFMRPDKSPTGSIKRS